SQEEAVGQPLPAIFAIKNEETGRPAENPVTRVLREGVIVGLANHTVLVGKDGTARPIDDSAAPIKDAAGTITGTVLIFRDVTEKRGAGQAVQASERQFRRIVETANEGIWVLDAEARINLVNDRMAEMLGYTRDEMLGRHKWDFIPEADQAAVRQLFNRRRTG